MVDRYTVRLTDLFDLSLSSPSNNQALVYNSVTKRWTNGSTSTGSGTGSFSLVCSWVAAENPNKLVLLTASQNVLITSIVGRLEVANGGVSTLSVVKAASGIAITSGTVLHTGSFNAQGTPATNQILALSTATALAYQSTNGAYEAHGVYMNSTGVIHVNAGDSIGIKTTGTYDTSIGCITITASYQ